MSKVLNITIELSDDNYNLSFVKDDTYARREVDNAEDVKTEIEKIISFVKNQKSDEEKAIEKANEEKQQIIDLIIEKTTDEEKENLIDIFNDYEVNKEYEVDDYFKYQGFLYKVIQEHISQENWIPGSVGTQSLYIQIGENNKIYEYGKNPDGTDRVLSVNPYKLGDRCIWQGKVYEWIDDRQDGIWSPTDYPQGWEYIREA